MRGSGERPNPYAAVSGDTDSYSRKGEKGMNTKAMFSSGKDDWETPAALFRKLDDEFHFTLDACATDQNHKCPRYYTREQNGLAQDWSGETVFCNPPYSRTGNQDAWVEKAFRESKKPGTTVVLLIPARTDTARFHDYIWGGDAEIRFLRGRLVFELDGKPVLDKNGRPQSAPFPSMIVVFR